LNNDDEISALLISALVLFNACKRHEDQPATPSPELKVTFGYMNVLFFEPFRNRDSANRDSMSMLQYMGLEFEEKIFRDQSIILMAITSHLYLTYIPIQIRSIIAPHKMRSSTLTEIREQQSRKFFSSRLHSDESQYQSPPLQWYTWIQSSWRLHQNWLCFAIQKRKDQGFSFRHTM